MYPFFRGMPEPMHDMVVYGGAPLERVTLDNLLATVPAKARDVNLASDIFTNEYGMIGFLLVDYLPGEGRGYWPEGWGWEAFEKEWEGSDGFDKGKDNLRAKCKYISFPGTLKIIRYFIMPDIIGDFFRSDRYLGEPMIEKITKEDLIPDEWWNPDDWNEHKVPWIGLNEDKKAQYREVIEDIEGIAKWKYDPWPGENHIAYQSFHLYQDFTIIRDIAQESVVKALIKFNQFLGRFDQKGKLNQIRRELNREGAQVYPTLLLPEDKTQ